MRIVVRLDETKEILREFRQELPSLSSGRIDMDFFAEKIHKNGFLCVCEDKEIVKGFSVFYANNKQTREAFLSMIAVKSACQKDGIGTRLLTFVEKKSHQEGMCFLRLEVNKKNKGAIAFYEKRGFSVCEQTEESWFMRKKIKGVQ